LNLFFISLLDKQGCPPSREEVSERLNYSELLFYVNYT
jgi:hypothetical protein